MDTESLVQPCRQFTSLETSEELAGHLEVRDGPEITTGYADIYHGVWTSPQGERSEVAIKEFKTLTPRSRQSDLEALRRRTDTVRSFERVSPSPWCRHGNLTDYLQASPELSRIDRLRLIYQTACGLDYLHSQTPPICHADIKPENVLINDGCDAALSDFGLSRVLQGLGIPSGFTTSERAKGTCSYMAGELFTGGKPDRSTDVYAFGGLILTVMSGKRPFFDLHEPNIMFRVMNDQPPKPDDHPHLPAHDLLWNLMRRCWDKDATARPTMPQVRWELCKYIEHEQSNMSSLDPPASNLDDGCSEYSDMDLDTPNATPRGGILSLLTPSPVLPDDSQWMSEAEDIRDLTAEGGEPAARKIFESLKVFSKTIPVIGTYLEAVAEVGFSLIAIILTIDQNENISSELGRIICNLAVFLEILQERTSAYEEAWASATITSAQRELYFVREKLEELHSSDTFQRAVSSRDGAGSLRCQGMVLKALKEIQLLINLNDAGLMIEFEHTGRQEHRRLLDRLGDGKYGAQGNSIQDVTCIPGTRVEILERMDNWIRDSSAPDRVLWLRGMAGRGKSTIASTVVENWKRRASCAIFHFRRGQNTLNTRVVCALARQLAGSLVPEVRKAMLDSVREKEDIADERLEEQFKTLFVASLAKLHNQTHPILIVVDALDECDNPKDAVALIRLIHEHSASFPANVKFLLTSRPEAKILQAFGRKEWRSEDLEKAPDVSNDLRQFIQQACQQIRDADSDVPQTWPSSEDVDRLVEMSQGLFQWARTVITYLSDGSPVDRLRDLLGRPSVWSELDDLYHQILSKAFDKVKRDEERSNLLHRVLGTLALAPYPISLEVVAGLYRDNRIFHSAVQADAILFLRKDILADLNSLLFIPTSPAEPIRLMHTSIHDLLISESRCKQTSYYVNVIQHHQLLASMCLNTMIRDLKENICGLSDLSKSVSEIRDSAEHRVPGALLYCCRSWFVHLTEGVQWPIQGTNAVSVQLAAFEVFSKEKLMFWLEVMSLAGVTRDAIIVAKNVCQWLRHCPDGVLESNSLATLWSDLQRFIAAFSEPIQFGPLHIYVSALPHCPVETELWKLYRHLAKVQTIKGLTTSTWPSNIWLRPTDNTVRTVAFSPDGTILASGSDDYTIRLWDAHTGTGIGEPLTGHSDLVWSVCFSPDGKVLASGSSDNTIRLWDPQTGTVIGEPLTGHSGSVYSVCFSPDGKVLASGSGDNTIRLCDHQTGTVIGEQLTGHSGLVCSICFSSDGKVLASGSIDNTIRLWDTQTGTVIGEPLTGHSALVRSVCFSPDGRVLASGSYDDTIQLWDTQTGTVIGEPLTGHSGKIHSICFSPDGKVLASGSDGQTIRVWDTQTRTVIREPLSGHGASVSSVCFSPDGKVLASGSADNTIRLWDTQSGTGIGKPMASHRNPIYSVCLSPDGKFLASGSDDHTIQFWDTQTGTAIGEPVTGHSSRVMSVCLSPDGNVLASGSGDGTIRLWDTQTGTAIGKPLTSHYLSVRSISFSPDGKVLASGSIDGTIRLWDTGTGTVIGEPLTGNYFPVCSVCFSPDGKVLASGSTDKTIRLWDPQTGMAIGEPLTGHSDWVYSVCFSPDGFLLGGRYPNGHCAAWDAVTRQRCDTPRSLPLHCNPPFQDHWVVFSSSRFIWLPPQYWGDDPSAEIFLSGNTLAVLHDCSLSLFDVSQALKL